jgi:GNAT superfamily N-acetyltransferase
MLWHGAEPVGICVFAAPAAALRARRVYFGLSGSWSRVRLQAWNAQLVNLSRVVLDPRYRGCGLATAFVRRSCETCRWPWIETLAEMGHFHPLFERAGFERVAPGADRRRAARLKGSREQHSEIYGARKHGRGKRLLSAEAHEKSRHAEPVYYVFDNRPGVRAG